MSQLFPVGQLQFFKNIRNMFFDSGIRNKETLGNFLIGQAFSDKECDFGLPGCQSGLAQGLFKRLAGQWRDVGAAVCSGRLFQDILRRSLGGPGLGQQNKVYQVAV